MQDPSGARAGRRAWWGLAVLALPTLLLSIDLSVLFLALPAIAADLGASGAEQLWIMDVYGLLVAGFLVTMGTLGDRIGRRRLLLIGAACFGGVSVLAAYASSAEALIAARALLGIAGATLAPATLALITHMFRDAGQRAVAVAVWAGCFMGGAVLGPVVGGLLLGRFWWGSVFLLAVPVMAVLLVAGPVLLPEHRAPSAGRIDPVSVGLSVAAVIPVVYGVKELGRGSGLMVPAVALAAGAAFGLLFVHRQRRRPDPILDLSLFRIRPYRHTLVLSLLVGALQGGGLLLVNMHLQLVEGLSATAAGLWLVPAAVAMLGGVALSTALARTHRPGRVIAAGMCCSAAGYLVLSQVSAGGGLGPVVIGMCLVMGGVGPMAALGYGLALGAAPVERAGAASATMEAGGQFGIAAGIGVLGSLAAAVYRDRLEVPEGLTSTAERAVRESLPGALEVAHRTPGPPGTELLESARLAFTSGLGLVAAASALIFIALAITTALTLRHEPPTQPR